MSTETKWILKIVGDLNEASNATEKLRIINEYRSSIPKEQQSSYLLDFLARMEAEFRATLTAESTTEYSFSFFFHDLIHELIYILSVCYHRFHHFNDRTLYIPLSPSSPFDTDYLFLSMPVAEHILVLDSNSVIYIY